MNESLQTLTPTPYEDEIDLRELFRVLWAGKWLIVGIACVTTIVAVGISLLLPNIYRAEALLAPAQSDRQGGLSALAAQYGGLASLAGVDLTAGTSNDSAMGIKVIRSRQFISDFVERHDILVELMAAKGWNRSSNTLRIDADLYESSTGNWVRDVSAPRTVVPSMQEAHKEFSEIIVN